MKKYRVYYNDGVQWTPFSVMGVNMYEALDWVHAHVQKTGTLIMGVDL